MATELQNRNQSIAISEYKLESTGKVVWHLNQVIAYPLSDKQIEDWSRSILELKPDIDLAALKFLIDKFKTGERDYDYHKGIQNIFLGLRSVSKNECGYQLMSEPVAVYIPKKEGTNNQETLEELDRRIKTGDYVKFEK